MERTEQDDKMDEGEVEVQILLTFHYLEDIPQLILIFDWL